MIFTSTEEFVALANKKEPLNHVLNQYLVSLPELGWRAIKHPLMFEIPYSESMNAFYNKRYKEISRVAQMYLLEENYKDYVWIHERPHRIHAFEQVRNNFTPDEYWELLSALWVDSENIWQNKDLWVSMLKAKIPGLALNFMSPKERDVIASKPKKFKLWRAYTPGLNQHGFSYTQDLNVAKKFAKRYKGIGVVGVFEVNRDDVIAYTNERDEQEFIIIKKQKFLKSIPAT